MSAWAPLRHHAYRILWLSSFVALTGSWISDSTAAWLMTSLSPSPLYVALISSAITLPILLMALRDRKNEFHLGAEPPVMRHLLMEPTESR